MIETELESLILHDLRNPLSGITGAVGLFTDGLLGVLTAEQKKYLDNIKLSARILTDMLADLSDLRNLENGVMQPAVSTCSAEAIIAGIKWLVDSAAAEGKRVEIEKPAASLKADKTLAIRILENFILSALRQAGKGEAVKINIKPAGAFVKFEVADQGESIPEALRKEAFDKLFKIKHPKLKTRVGRALSFYFCKLAVAAMGGEVGMTAGSAFFFTLPRA